MCAHAHARGGGAMPMVPRSSDWKCFYLPWRAASSEIISKHAKCICIIIIFMGQMSCWNKEASKRNKPQRGHRTTDQHVLITVSDLFLFMAENHWSHPHPRPSDVIQRGQSPRCVFTKWCMQNQETMMDDYVLGSLAPQSVLGSHY